LQLTLVYSCLKFRQLATACTRASQLDRVYRRIVWHLGLHGTYSQQDYLRDITRDTATCDYVTCDAGNCQGQTYTYWPTSAHVRKLHLCDLHAGCGVDVSIGLLYIRTEPADEG